MKAASDSAHLSVGFRGGTGRPVCRIVAAQPTERVRAWTEPHRPLNSARFGVGTGKARMGVMLPGKADEVFPAVCGGDMAFLDGAPKIEASFRRTETNPGEMSRQEKAPMPRERNEAGDQASINQKLRRVYATCIFPILSRGPAWPFRQAERALAQRICRGASGDRGRLLFREPRAALEQPPDARALRP